MNPLSNLFNFTYWLALLCVLPLTACTTTYSAEAIEAWVVDAETGQPIEGVVVTANWQLERGTPGGNVRAGQIMVMEAATDAKGRFYFPQWGPKFTPIGFPLPHLVTDDPHMVFFKPGYKWTGVANYPTSNYNTSSLRKSEWSGKTIKMEKFKGTLLEYEQHLSFIRSSLLFLDEECHWQKIPKMVLALDQQYQEFMRAGIDSSMNVIGKLEGIPPARNCGLVREYLKSSQT